jgi:hypothetical protein
MLLLRTPHKGRPGFGRMMVQIRMMVQMMIG